MTSRNLQHRRNHHLLLISRVLNLRENASPLTLIIDSVEQSAKGLIRGFIQRAKAAKIAVTYVSFETEQRPAGLDSFVDAQGRSTTELQRDITSKCSGLRSLIVIDSLQPLAATCAHTLPAFLSSLLRPSVSLVSIYHSDVPLDNISTTAYAPHPITLLEYLSTTVLKLHSLHQMIAKKEARNRSRVEPLFGSEEGVEGVVVGNGANDRRGTVVEMEYRRKSGRAVQEWFFLPRSTVVESDVRKAAKEHIVLLDDHPLYGANDVLSVREHADVDDTMEGTFNLELTAKQKRDREGVVLPYFDAQKEGPLGEGGRILYNMGEEDDFDEEEDEI
ncbi:MAG: hypothetical protein M1833_001397 [Piccolia ochrophora]|nr:MAG: hypothetical protein M1833_001397 [Piccolia ochrophora]